MIRERREEVFRRHLVKCAVSNSHSHKLFQQLLSTRKYLTIHSTIRSISYTPTSSHHVSSRVYLPIGTMFNLFITEPSPSRHHEAVPYTLLYDTTHTAQRFRRCKALTMSGR